MLRFAYLIEPPFCFRTPDGRVTGCDVELARLLVERLGLGPFQPIETTFAELLQGLAEDRWDMTTGLFVTAERQLIARFSSPIWELPDGLLVQAGNPRLIEGYRSFATATLRLAVVSAQVQHRTAMSLGVPERAIRSFPSYQEAAAAVLSGAADGYASVAQAHRGYLEQNPHIALGIVDVATEEKPAEVGAFAFAWSSGSLAAAIDRELALIVGSPPHRALMERFGVPVTLLPTGAHSSGTSGLVIPRLAQAEADGYSLADGVELNRLYPDTFHIPSQAVRTRVREGTLVKLLFKYSERVRATSAGIEAERMWVRITGRIGPYLQGVLINEPHVQVSGGGPLRLHTIVFFLHDHIIDIE